MVEDIEKTTIIDKLDHIMLNRLNGIRTQNVSGDRY